MWRKAVYFGDAETARKIMRAKHPEEQKQLGRQVANFNMVAWKRMCLKIMKEALLCKFSQNPNLKEQLLKTEKILVEASPYDTYWGIGCCARDEAAGSLATWKGENKLGYLLTECRDELRHSGI